MIPDAKVLPTNMTTPLLAGALLTVTSHREPTVIAFAAVSSCRSLRSGTMSCIQMRSHYTGVLRQLRSIKLCIQGFRMHFL